jgi:hypothetical protein
MVTKDIFIGINSNEKTTITISIYDGFVSSDEKKELIQPGNYEIKTIDYLIDLNSDVMNLFEGHKF